MERVQLKGLWSQERIIFSMEDMNDLLERERLVLQKFTQREKIIFGRRWDPEHRQGLLLFRGDLPYLLNKEMCGSKCTPRYGSRRMRANFILTVS